VAGIGGGGFMMSVFPYADGEAYFDVTKPSFLGIVVPEEQSAHVAAVLRQVQEMILPFPGVKLHDYHSSLDPVVDMIGQLELLLDGLLLLAVVVAALGVVNTTVINVAERQREIGLLRAVGATQQQVRRAFVAEAGMMGLLAALVADLLGLLMLLSWGLLVLPNGTASVGVRPDWETIQLTVGAGFLDWGRAAAASLVFGPLVAGLAAYYPARRAAARPVVEATRSEQVALKRPGASARRQTRTRRADSP
jgi:putative ABC transport system permease protein